MLGAGRFTWDMVWRAAILAGLFACSPPSYAQTVTVGPTQQQINDRIKSLSAAEKSAPHDYVIGSGDLLFISVFEVPELSREVRVSQTGTIGLPLVPVRLRVSGLTELQAEQKIAEVLEAKGLVSHPEVGVTVKEHRSKPITIVGAVNHPIVYNAERPVTLLEALAEAGGVANDAGDVVIVSRSHAATFVEVTDPAPVGDHQALGSGEPPPLDSYEAAPAQGDPAKTPVAGSGSSVFPSAAEMKQDATQPTEKNKPDTAGGPDAPSGNTMTINLNELIETGDLANNISLQAGDVVTVPHAGIIYVLGAVNRPGGFVIANDRTEFTTMKVLSLAGGLTKIAKLSQAYIIRRDAQGKQTETQVDLKKILHRQEEDVQLRASDILYIPDDRTKEAILRTTELAIALGSSVALYRLAYH